MVKKGKGKPITFQNGKSEKNQESLYRYIDLRSKIRSCLDSESETRGKRRRERVIDIELLPPFTDRRPILAIVCQEAAACQEEKHESDRVATPCNPGRLPGKLSKPCCSHGAAARPRREMILKRSWRFPRVDKVDVQSTEIPYIPCCQREVVSFCCSRD